MKEKKVINDLSYNQLQNICGINDENLKIIADLLAVKVIVNDDLIEIYGALDNIDLAIAVVKALKECDDRKQFFTSRDIIYLCQLAINNMPINIAKLYEQAFTANNLGKFIYPKTKNQKFMFEAMQDYDIVFAIGPAGAGKTYLAVAYGLSLLKKNQVNRLVLTRPAVEAGENLGFLPGDLKEKIDPYLQPLYDALHDILGAEKVEKYLANGIIEVAPLAFMRGRTLENAFVILDEAQNTTYTQMKMFLTRLGFHSKMVITGDITQIDLPKNCNSGLLDCLTILQSVKEIKMIHLSSIDVVRNPLV